MYVSDLYFIVQWFRLIPLKLFSDFELFTYFWPQRFVEVSYENVCEYSKVGYWPVVYSKREAEASVYFGHNSSFIYLFIYLFIYGKLTKTWFLATKR